MVGFLLTGMVFGASSGIAPGPLLTLTVSETLRHGPRAGFKVALAPVITDAPIIFLSWFLLSQMRGFETILGLIALAGALFLVYLAYDSFRVRPLSEEEAGIADHALGKGILTNFLNPSPYLFWATVGAPMLVKASAWGSEAATLYLLAFYFCIVGSKMMVAVLTARFREFLRSRYYLALNKTMGALLLMFALFYLKDAAGFFGFWP